MDLTTVLDYLGEHKYLAMFGILFLCGIGLPIPEEVTLIGSGLLVGWEQADFWYASLACVAGILVGDSIIFGLGYAYGPRFLRSRPMRLLLSPRRRRKVAKFFEKHGNKAVFLARFFAGVRIGVYAYAGSQRMNWWRFLFLDLLGALISGPTSIYLGKLAAELFDPEEAQTKAVEFAREFGFGILALIFLGFLGYFASRRIFRRSREHGRATVETAPSQESPQVSPDNSPPATEKSENSGIGSGVASVQEIDGMEDVDSMSEEPRADL